MLLLRTDYPGIAVASMDMFKTGSGRMVELAWKSDKMQWIDAGGGQVDRLWKDTS